jgi:hypothetical protein
MYAIMLGVSCSVDPLLSIAPLPGVLLGLTLGTWIERVRR